MSAQGSPLAPAPPAHPRPPKQLLIDTYKSLEERLSGEGLSVGERARDVSAVWSNVRALCVNAAPSTHLHLLDWAHRHSYALVLQKEWQQPSSEALRALFDETLRSFIEESDGRSDPPDWEKRLAGKARVLLEVSKDPWGHPVLRALLDPKAEQPDDDRVLSWLLEERGSTLVARLRQLSASKCDDLAMSLVTSVMERLRASDDASQTQDADGAGTSYQVTPEWSVQMQKEGGFTNDVLESLIDIELVLLHKLDNSKRCIELVKRAPLSKGHVMVDRLRKRAETAPRKQKLWKNAADVATLIAQVMVARCMVTPKCTDQTRVALYYCARELARLLPSDCLPSTCATLAAPAATATHLHTLTVAIKKATGDDMRPLVCELYIRALNTGMNELERLKLHSETELEARQTEQLLASWFLQLADLLISNQYVSRECILTAFSVHPSRRMFELVQKCPSLPDHRLKESVKPDVATTSDFGSWACDSNTKTNLVKTSETLAIRASVDAGGCAVSGAVVEGEGLGLSGELCQDLAVLLSNPRIKTLRWEMDREQLLMNCRAYMERTGAGTRAGTRAFTTELKYLNLESSELRHLPFLDEDDESDAFYGIEKGYEHLVQPESEEERELPLERSSDDIWNSYLGLSDFENSSDDTSDDSDYTESNKNKYKTKDLIVPEDVDPLSLDPYESRSRSKERKHKKKHRKHSKERHRSDSRDKNSKESHKKHSKDRNYSKDKYSKERKDKSKKKEKSDKNKHKKSKKERVGKETPKGPMSKLVGTQVKRRDSVSQPPLDIQKNIQEEDKRLIENLIKENYPTNNEDTQVVVDGLFSMDLDMKSPPDAHSKINISKTSCTVSNIYGPSHSLWSNSNLAPKVETTTSKNFNDSFAQAIAKSSLSNQIISKNVTSTKIINEDVKAKVADLIKFRKQKPVQFQSPAIKASLEQQNTVNARLHDSVTAMVNSVERKFYQPINNATALSTSEKCQSRAGAKIILPELLKQSSISKELTQEQKSINQNVEPNQPKSKKPLEGLVIKYIGKVNNHIQTENHGNILVHNRQHVPNIITKTKKEKVSRIPDKVSIIRSTSENISNPGLKANWTVSSVNKTAESAVEDFLKELAATSNAGANKTPIKKNPNLPLPNVNVRPMHSYVNMKVTQNVPQAQTESKTSKPLDLNQQKQSEADPKINKQSQKICENAPNTFARLNYMHKAKQNETTKQRSLLLKKSASLKKENCAVSNLIEQSQGVISISSMEKSQNVAPKMYNSSTLVSQVEKETSILSSFPLVAEILQANTGMQMTAVPPVQMTNFQSVQTMNVQPIRMTNIHSVQMTNVNSSQIKNVQSVQMTNIQPGQITTIQPVQLTTVQPFQANCSVIPARNPIPSLNNKTESNKSMNLVCTQKTLLTENDQKDLISLLLQQTKLMNYANTSQTQKLAANRPVASSNVATLQSVGQYLTNSDARYVTTAVIRPPIINKRISPPLKQNDSSTVHQQTFEEILADLSQIPHSSKELYPNMTGVKSEPSIIEQAFNLSPMEVKKITDNSSNKSTDTKTQPVKHKNTKQYTKKSKADEKAPDSWRSVFDDLLSHKSSSRTENVPDTLNNKAAVPTTTKLREMRIAKNTKVIKSNSNTVKVPGCIVSTSNSNLQHFTNLKIQRPSVISVPTTSFASQEEEKSTFDYPFFDEEMDKDLLREINEMSSDEETKTASTSELLSLEIGTSTKTDIKATAPRILDTSTKMTNSDSKVNTPSSISESEHNFRYTDDKGNSKSLRFYCKNKAPGDQSKLLEELKSNVMHTLSNTIVPKESKKSDTPLTDSSKIVSTDSNKKTNREVPLVGQSAIKSSALIGTKVMGMADKIKIATFQKSEIIHTNKSELVTNNKLVNISEKPKQKIQILSNEVICTPITKITKKAILKDKQPLKKTSRHIPGIIEKQEPSQVEKRLLINRNTPEMVQLNELPTKSDLIESLLLGLPQINVSKVPKKNVISANKSIIPKVVIKSKEDMPETNVMDILNMEIMQKITSKISPLKDTSRSVNVGTHQNISTKLSKPIQNPDITPGTSSFKNPLLIELLNSPIKANYEEDTKDKTVFNKEDIQASHLKDVITSAAEAAVADRIINKRLAILSRRKDLKSKFPPIPLGYQKLKTENTSVSQKNKKASQTAKPLNILERVITVQPALDTSLVTETPIIREAENLQNMTKIDNEIVQESQADKSPAMHTQSDYRGRIRPINIQSSTRLRSSARWTTIEDETLEAASTVIQKDPKIREAENLQETAKIDDKIILGSNTNDSVVLHTHSDYEGQIESVNIQLSLQLRSSTRCTTTETEKEAASIKIRTGPKITEAKNISHDTAKIDKEIIEESETCVSVNEHTQNEYEGKTESLKIQPSARLRSSVRCTTLENEALEAASRKIKKTKPDTKNNKISDDNKGATPLLVEESLNKSSKVMPKMLIKLNRKAKQSLNKHLAKSNANTPLKRGRPRKKIAEQPLAQPAGNSETETLENNINKTKAKQSKNKSRDVNETKHALDIEAQIQTSTILNESSLKTKRRKKIKRPSLKTKYDTRSKVSVVSKVNIKMIENIIPDIMKPLQNIPYMKDVPKIDTESEQCIDDVLDFETQIQSSVIKNNNNLKLIDLDRPRLRDGKETEKKTNEIIINESVQIDKEKSHETVIGNMVEPMKKQNVSKSNCDLVNKKDKQTILNSAVIEKLKSLSKSDVGKPINEIESVNIVDTESETESSLKEKSASNLTITSKPVLEKLTHTQKENVEVISSESETESSLKEKSVLKLKIATKLGLEIPTVIKKQKVGDISSESETESPKKEKSELKSKIKNPENVKENEILTDVPVVCESNQVELTQTSVPVKVTDQSLMHKLPMEIKDIGTGHQLSVTIDNLRYKATIVKHDRGADIKSLISNPEFTKAIEKQFKKSFSENSVMNRSGTPENIRIVKFTTSKLQPKTVAVIDLSSDEDEYEPIALNGKRVCKVNTEFGMYYLKPIEKGLLKNHQKQLKKKCTVRLERANTVDIVKKNKWRCDLGNARKKLKVTNSSEDDDVVILDWQEPSEVIRRIELVERESPERMKPKLITHIQHKPDIQPKLVIKAKPLTVNLDLNLDDDEDELYDVTKVEQSENTMKSSLTHHEVSVTKLKEHIEVGSKVNVNCEQTVQPFVKEIIEKGESVNSGNDQIEIQESASKQSSNSLIKCDLISKNILEITVNRTEEPQVTIPRDLGYIERLVNIHLPENVLESVEKEDTGNIKELTNSIEMIQIEIPAKEVGNTVISEVIDGRAKIGVIETIQEPANMDYQQQMDEPIKTIVPEITEAIAELQKIYELKKIDEPDPGKVKKSVKMNEFAKIQKSNTVVLKSTSESFMSEKSHKLNVKKFSQMNEPNTINQTEMNKKQGSMSESGKQEKRDIKVHIESLTELVKLEEHEKVNECENIIDSENIEEPANMEESKIILDLSNNFDYHHPVQENYMIPTLIYIVTEALNKILSNAISKRENITADNICLLSKTVEKSQYVDTYSTHSNISLESKILATDTNVEMEEQETSTSENCSKKQATEEIVVAKYGLRGKRNCYVDDIEEGGGIVTSEKSDSMEASVNTKKLKKCMATLESINQTAKIKCQQEPEKVIVSGEIEELGNTKEPGETQVSTMFLPVPENSQIIIEELCANDTILENRKGPVEHLDEKTAINLCEIIKEKSYEMTDESENQLKSGTPELNMLEVPFKKAEAEKIEQPETITESKHTDFLEGENKSYMKTDIFREIVTEEEEVKRVSDNQNIKQIEENICKIIEENHSNMIDESGSKSKSKSELKLPIKLDILDGPQTLEEAENTEEPETITESENTERPDFLESENKYYLKTEEIVTVEEEAERVKGNLKDKQIEENISKTIEEKQSNMINELGNKSKSELKLPIKRDILGGPQKLEEAEETEEPETITESENTERPDFLESENKSYLKTEEIVTVEEEAERVKGNLIAKQIEENIFKTIEEKQSNMINELGNKSKSELKLPIKRDILGGPQKLEEAEETEEPETITESENTECTDFLERDNKCCLKTEEIETVEDEAKRVKDNLKTKQIEENICKTIEETNFNMIHESGNKSKFKSELKLPIKLDILDEPEKLKEAAETEQPETKTESVKVEHSQLKQSEDESYIQTDISTEIEMTEKTVERVTEYQNVKPIEENNVSNICTVVHHMQNIESMVIEEELCATMHISEEYLQTHMAFTLEDKCSKDNTAKSNHESSKENLHQSPPKESKDQNMYADPKKTDTKELSINYNIFKSDSKNINETKNDADLEMKGKFIPYVSQNPTIISTQNEEQMCFENKSTDLYKTYNVTDTREHAIEETTIFNDASDFVMKTNQNSNVQLNNEGLMEQKLSVQNSIPINASTNIDMLHTEEEESMYIEPQIELKYNSIHEKYINTSESVENQTFIEHPISSSLISVPSSDEKLNQEIMDILFSIMIKVEELQKSLGEIVAPVTELETRISIIDNETRINSPNHRKGNLSTEKEITCIFPEISVFQHGSIDFGKDFTVSLEEMDENNSQELLNQKPNDLLLEDTSYCDSTIVSGIHKEIDEYSINNKSSIEIKVVEKNETKNNEVIAKKDMNRTKFESYLETTIDIKNSNDPGDHNEITKNIIRAVDKKEEILQQHGEYKMQGQDEESRKRDIKSSLSEFISSELQETAETSILNVDVEVTKEREKAEISVENAELVLINDVTSAIISYNSETVDISSETTSRIPEDQNGKHAPHYLCESISVCEVLNTEILEDKSNSLETTMIIEDLPKVLNEDEAEYSQVDKTTTTLHESSIGVPMEDDLEISKRHSEGDDIKHFKVLNEASSIKKSDKSITILEPEVNVTVEIDSEEILDDLDESVTNTTSTCMQNKELCAEFMHKSKITEKLSSTSNILAEDFHENEERTIEKSAENIETSPAVEMVEVVVKTDNKVELLRISSDITKSTTKDLESNQEYIRPPSYKISVEADDESSESDSMPELEPIDGNEINLENYDVDEHSESSGMLEKLAVIEEISLSEEDIHKIEDVKDMLQVSEDTSVIKSAASISEDEIYLAKEEVYIYSTDSIDKSYDSEETVLDDENNPLDLPELRNVDLLFMLPKKTYSTLKRKLEMTSVKVPKPKKYRKAQGIDTPKQSKEGVDATLYKTYFEKLTQYQNAMKLSHKQIFLRANPEDMEFGTLGPLRNVQINHALLEENTNLDSSELFKDVQHLSTDQSSKDIKMEDKSDLAPIEKSDMGFGEGSDRVIVYLKKANYLNVSAATLSDVKHQPFLLSEHSENDKKNRNLNKTGFCYKSMRNKVRAYFETYMQEKTNIPCSKNATLVKCKFPNIFKNIPGLYSTDFLTPPSVEEVVHVVQVGQLAVSVGAQNPVSCDPRVSQATDASPSQCSVDNSPQSGLSDSTSSMSKAKEYTELITADLSMPMAMQVSEENDNMETPQQEGDYQVLQNVTPQMYEAEDRIENADQSVETHEDSIHKNTEENCENKELTESRTCQYNNTEAYESTNNPNYENTNTPNYVNTSSYHDTNNSTYGNTITSTYDNTNSPANDNSNKISYENSNTEKCENSNVTKYENSNTTKHEILNTAKYKNMSTPTYENTTTPINSLCSQAPVQFVFTASQANNVTEHYHTRQENGIEKNDQIANAMTAAGIATTKTTRAQALVNIISQNIVKQPTNNASVNSTYSKSTSINAMAIQQALAHILPPPLNQTSKQVEHSLTNTNIGQAQVLHIVQGKNASGNQITLVDNQQSVIGSPGGTQVLHIVQNKSASGASANGAQVPTSSFGGISLVEGIHQGGNQLLQIVNAAANQNKANNTAQLLKRVNLLTSLANVQGSNDQKMVQFVCKSADGKSIQLNAPHQRSMVLRLQPIETPPPNVQVVKSDTQDPSPNLTVTSGLNVNTTQNDLQNQQEIKSRSIYEENYAKFIQNSNDKPLIADRSNSSVNALPKFNQAFGKTVYQESNTSKPEENQSNIQIINNSSENNEINVNNQDNSVNMDQIRQINSPPLLIRKPPTQLQVSQAQQNIVHQIKQTIAPMNIQTMHGGVIYTRQIPVNIGGGQTINLITVPSTELVDDSIQKQPSEVKFVNQSEPEQQSIIKIIPQSQILNMETNSDERDQNIRESPAPQGQSQQVLTQMRIKLPMLSKSPQVGPGTRLVRPFFQIQRNLIAGTNQPVYQQLVLTTAPPLGHQTIRLPHPQQVRQVKVPTQPAESNLSTSTLEQLREFDMVLEQVKERSTVQPTGGPFSNLKAPDNQETTVTVAAIPAVDTQQVLYSIGTNQALNVAYVNRKGTIATPTTTFVRSPDSTGIADSPSSTHMSHSVSDSSTDAQVKPAKIGSKSSKSRSHHKPSSTSPGSLKTPPVAAKTSSAQKPLEDEQTTQRILYILAEYKEQVENSPDKDKPAPRRRSNPPTNPGGGGGGGSSKRKKGSGGSSRRTGRDSSPGGSVDDPNRTMGSEDSSCGTSQGDCSESCVDTQSPQGSPRKVARKLNFEHEINPPPIQQRPQRNVILADGQTIAVTRSTGGQPATAVLMPANYLLPVSMMKGGQQIAIVTNRGPKILTMPQGEPGSANALLLQRLIGPAGLKPMLTRPGVRHVRLPTAALHNLQAFNLATTHIPTSQANVAMSPAPSVASTEHQEPPDTWQEPECQVEVKTEESCSGSEAGETGWRMNAANHTPDYTYEEPSSGMHQEEAAERTVLGPIHDRYSPDIDTHRIFDKMFDVDAKKCDSPRTAQGYDLDVSHSDCEEKPFHQVVHKKQSTSHGGFVASHGGTLRHMGHVSAAALRHKYAILEHELRLQKSLSEECEDLGVDSPSASELFPEAELLFAASPAHDHSQDHAHHHVHHAQMSMLGQSCISQPDLDDQMATDHIIPEPKHEQETEDLKRHPLEERMEVNLGDVGIVTVSGDGLQRTITLDQEEFARAHPNTTFHSEPTEEEVQPFTIAQLKTRHIASTIFHQHNSAPTVLMTAPAHSVISHVAPDVASAPTGIKYSVSDIGNMINVIPGQQNDLTSVLVKDDRLTRYDSILTDSRELHLSNSASAIVHSGQATQVIRRVGYDHSDKSEHRDSRFSMDENDAIAGDDAKMSVAEDSSREATLESMGGDADDDESSPERHAELFWESNSASASESRRPLDFSSDSDKCCKSPSLDETNSTDSSIGRMRLDSVIKEARRRERCGSGGSSVEDTHPPIRTYPAKRIATGGVHEERSVSGKTRAGGEHSSPDSPNLRRRTSVRGVVKRGCHCCNGSPEPSRPKKPRKKPSADFTPHD